MAGSNITVPESLMAELEKAAKSEQRSTDAVAHEAIERSRSWNRHAARLRAAGIAGQCRAGVGMSANAARKSACATRGL
jgi:hypothetical protein